MIRAWVDNSSKAFFNPERSRPVDIADRIVDGTVNPHLDDLFSVSLQETVSEAEAVRTKMLRLAVRKAQIERELQELEAKHERLVGEFDEKRSAIEQYQESGEVADILLPDTAKLAGAEEDRLAKEEVKKIDIPLPNGWEITNRRADEEYYYVTVRCARPERPIEVPEQVQEAVSKAFENYSAPEFDRQARVQASLRRFHVLNHFGMPP